MITIKNILDRRGLTLIELVVVLMLLMAFALMTGVLAYAGPAVGTVTATGADQTVKIGFRPTHVVITNSSGWQLRWHAGMPSDSAVKITNTPYAETGLSLSNGISLYNGTFDTTTGKMTNAPGFHIGADADINVDGQTLYYDAWN